MPVSVVDDVYVRVSAVGPQGSAGPKGPSGPSGPPGASYYFAGTYTLSPDAPGPPPASGTTFGHVMVNTYDGVMWQWQQDPPNGLPENTQGKWELCGPIVGPTGPIGPVGSLGPVGPQGPSGIAGSEVDVRFYEMSLEQGLIVNGSGTYYAFRSKQDADAINDPANAIPVADRVNPQRNFTMWTALETVDINLTSGVSAFKDARYDQRLTVDDVMRVDDRSSFHCGLELKVVGAAPVTHSYIIECLARDFSVIATTNYAYRAGTRTTLATDLTPGDTTIQLTDLDAAQAFANDVTSGAADRALIIFNWTSADGVAYEHYTRNVTDDDLWDINSIVGAVITLQSAWAGVTIPAGTSVANAIPAPTAIATNVLQPIPELRESVVSPDVWRSYRGVVLPSRTDGAITPHNLRPGTEFVRIGLVINQAATAPPTPQTVLSTGYIFGRTPYRVVDDLADLNDPRFTAFTKGELLVERNAPGELVTVYYYDEMSPGSFGWQAIGNADGFLPITGGTVTGDLSVAGSLAVTGPATFSHINVTSTTKSIYSVSGNMYLKNDQDGKNVQVNTVGTGYLVNRHVHPYAAVQVSQSNPPATGTFDDFTLWLVI